MRGGKRNGRIQKGVYHRLHKSGCFQIKLLFSTLTRLKEEMRAKEGIQRGLQVTVSPPTLRREPNNGINYRKTKGDSV